MSGQTGVFTAWRNNAIAMTPIAEAAGKNRLVSPKDPLLAAARAVGLEFGD
jgi:6-phosphofructokinase 1